MKKTIIITGMTSGIGLAIFKDLLAQGHHVIGISRSQEKLNQIEHEMKTEGHKDFALFKADFSMLSDVDDVAKNIIHAYPKGIDVLINNAAIVPNKKRITKDGYEMQFQVNHLSVVKLSFLLLDAVSLNKGIIITTSSNAHRMAKYPKKDIQSTKRYFSFKSYGRTKLYNIYFTDAFNDYIGPKHNVYAYAVHPGLVKTEIGTKDTSKLYAWFWKVFTKNGITPETAVKTYDMLINQEKRDESYSYYYKSEKEPKSKVASNVDDRDDLWQKTLDILNIKPSSTKSH